MVLGLQVGGFDVGENRFANVGAESGGSCSWEEGEESFEEARWVPISMFSKTIW